MKRRGQNRKTGHGAENSMIAKIDEKTFQEYNAKILKGIRQDLLNGMKAEEILKKYEAHAAAALVSSLINPITAQGAAEKILDRTQGKATQRTESTHKFEKLKDEELDALLQSRLTEIEDDATPKKGMQ